MAFSITFYKDDKELPGSDNFWIEPVDPDRLESGEPYGMPAGNTKNIRLILWEDDVTSFLLLFFNRWLDPNYKWQNKYNHEGQPVKAKSQWEFDQWGWNYYSYGQVRNMISDLRTAANQFEKDPENKELDMYRRMFTLYCMMDTTDPDYLAYEEDSLGIKARTREEYSEKLYQIKYPIIIKHIHPVISFYRELADALEEMLDSMPECDTV